VVALDDPADAVALGLQDAAGVVADSRAALRILETSHPPTWYLPPTDVRADALIRSEARSTFCEWKGSATYWDVVGRDGSVLTAAAWSYETPTPGYEALAGYLAFSPARLHCTVDGEVVRPQEGGFYAGWITDDVIGPFKGAPGTLGW
jgi:uncharacterized protein (DUF427 family)